MARQDAQRPPTIPLTDGFPEVLSSLDRATSLARWQTPAIGGPRFAAARRRDPPARCQPFPRLTVILDGRMRYASSARGERTVVDGIAGSLFFWATNAWNLEFWDTPTEFLGCVFRPDFVRVLRFAHPGGATAAGPARTAHHTRAPLGAAGRQLLASLDALADDGPPAGLLPCVGDLLRGLVAMTRAHVAADLAGGVQDGARRTWQEAMQYLAEHLQEDVSRESVATALGLHPNYLSALFTRHGGASFHATLAGLRIDRAKVALRQDPELPIAEVGRRCGYADAGHFIRVFKRRTGRTPGRFARR